MFKTILKILKHVGLIIILLILVAVAGLIVMRLAVKSSIDDSRRSNTSISRDILSSSISDYSYLKRIKR